MRNLIVGWLMTLSFIIVLTSSLNSQNGEDFKLIPEQLKAINVCDLFNFYQQEKLYHQLNLGNSVGTTKYSLDPEPNISESNPEYVKCRLDQIEGKLDGINDRLEAVENKL